MYISIVHLIFILLHSILCVITSLVEETMNTASARRGQSQGAVTVEGITVLLPEAVK